MSKHAEPANSSQPQALTSTYRPQSTNSSNKQAPQAARGSKPQQAAAAATSKQQAAKQASIQQSSNKQVQAGKTVARSNQQDHQAVQTTGSNMHTLNTLVDVDGVQDGPRRRLDAPNTPSRGSQDAPRRPRRPPRRYEFPTCSVQPQVDGVHGSALVSYNAGISACEKGEQWQRALALLSEMREAKLEPNVISPTTLGYARARTKLAERASPGLRAASRGPTALQGAQREPQ